MLKFDEAQARFAASVAPVRESERVWLELAAGRVLARELASHTGDPLPPAGTLLQPGHIAALAAQGYNEVPVYRLVEVALLRVGEAPTEDAPDANGPMLEALVHSLGAVVRRRGGVAEDGARLHDALVELVEEGECDAVVVYGGHGVGGAPQLFAAALVAAGGELLCRQVQMNPGRSVLLGRLRDRPLVCLPADAAAAYVTFVLLATPMVRRMQGRASIYPPVSRVEAAAGGFAVPRHGEGDAFWRVERATGADGTDRVRATPAPDGSVATLGDASGLVRIAPHMSERTQVRVPYYDLSRWLC